jgi:GTPase SAR1 family protein
METQKVSVAIAGRTNAGKTTLIRTLMKTSIGEVNDSPNVTKKGQAYYFDSLQATFIDTPGFQYASVIVMYLDALDEDPTFQMPQKWKDKLAYDHDAIAALDNSDAIIYVASLSIVPDDSFNEEISIVKRKCSKVVALINQYEKQLKASSQPEIENRIKQWKALFHNHSIDHVVVFDAHWDNPAKINQVYGGILDILEPEKHLRFVEGLKRFKERQSDITRETCDMLASLIRDCEEKAIITISKGDFDKKEKQEEAKEQVARKINGSLAEFVYCVSDLYKVAAEHPTTSKDELCLLMKPKPNFSGRLGWGSGGAAILGAAAAVISGILGGAIMGILTGGVGAIPGALAWAQVGGTAGAAIGSLFVFMDDGDTVTIKINEEQLKNLSVKGISIIWGLSNNGYGRGRELSLEEGKYIEQKVRQAQSSCREFNFTKSNKIDILEYCEKILGLLEKENT